MLGIFALFVIVIPKVALSFHQSPTATATATAATTKTFATSSSKNTMTKNNDEVIMLSGYPVYLNGANPSDLQAVFDKTQSIFQDLLGDQFVSAHRMGSSAIDGIAGTPVCDIVVEVSPWPINDENKAKLLAEAGYECKGDAPHGENDEWFFGGDAEPGHLGRVVLHSVPKGSKFVEDTKAFVEYVKSHPEAFERYNTVKVEGAILMSKSDEEDGLLLGYKKTKAKVCNEIMAEAIKWWSEKKKEE